jgi:hypothetical protein
MLLFAVFTAIVFLVAIIVLVIRGLEYLREHPELLTSDTPLAYQRCHTTLAEVIARYKSVTREVTPRMVITWQSPAGRFYRISGDGVEERADPGTLQGVYRLRWDYIGGVGLRMQPGFRLVHSRRGRAVQIQYTSGYSFQLLIVPVSGDTLEIPIPTNGRTDAVDFVAYTVALAERMGKRVNTFGFDKPPAPYRQKMPKR